MDEIRFIDLFGGIGGASLGLETADKRFKCVGYYDFDKRAVACYNHNFGTSYEPTDITKLDANSIPDHELLVGGFPCQSFSIAGQRKGFADTRGTMFFEIARILEVKRPSYLLLENVKGLLNHDKGGTFRVILQTLDALGYDIQWMVLNSKFFGVPQNRERVFIVGNLRGKPRPKILPFGESDGLSEDQDGQKREGCVVASTLAASCYKGVGNDGMTLIRRKEIVVDMQNSTIMEKDAVGTLQAEGMARQNRGFAIIQVNNPQHSNNRVYSEDGISPALRDMSAGGNRQPKILQHVRNAEGKVTHYNLNDIAGTLKQPSGNTKNFVLEQAEDEPKGVAYRTHNYRDEPGHIIERKDDVANQLTTVQKDSMLMKNAKIRRLTPIECERLQGFPDFWTANGQADTHRYRQLGNAMTVNVLKAIGKALASEIAQETRVIPQD